LRVIARPSPEIVVCHAVGDDLQRYVKNAEDADAALASACRGFAGAELLVGGHTHFAAFHGGAGAFRFAHAGTSERLATGRLQHVNPGSVGQPRDGIPVARYARYDSATRIITWRAVGYDSAPTEAKLRKLRLVARVCYSFPQPWLERKVDQARTRWARTRFQRLPLFRERQA
jgi:diadenosine tetraphosphatase ApaH/serine/threonine PP2A family protein phosphatase